MKLIQGDFAKLPASNIAPDFAESLRQLADAIDAGRVASCVLACVQDGAYMVLKPSSPSDSLVLASLLHASVMRDFMV